ncbi:hypothetical protein O6H91_15G058500 [Diphasiastrum complanatum]|uniref:Uncharacterized protein n=1 Tax=Diphasiastrum complanatum TaxID=34168 RepID=A0ACC2BIR6_DIPCM|nr:hypothetical protein O6H91_15G058500 [Diphasiastrum complanatum]
MAMVKVRFFVMDWILFFPLTLQKDFYSNCWTSFFEEQLNGLHAYESGTRV